MALVEMILSLQPYIPMPPVSKETLWNTATRNDEITVKSWDKIWVSQTKANRDLHDFGANSAMSEHGKCGMQPVILAGSGPSLKKNWQDLMPSEDGKRRGRQGIKIVSCAHNFPFFEDRDVMGPEDYYVSLDAGPITIPELSEGGKHAEDPEWYWNRTKDRTLIAYHGSHPDFIKKWQGPIKWFTTPYATQDLAVKFSEYVEWAKVPCFNVGGNVLGASLYFARAILGCSIPIFIGADFSFDYTRKFHAWDSAYDQQFSGVMPCTDIYGNRVFTWGSYFNFKNWFEYIACGGSGGNAQLFINATEGGILGAWPDGNIQQIIQADLKTALSMFTVYTVLPKLMEDSADGKLHILY